MNIECGPRRWPRLEHAFKFNDAVLRHLIVAMRGGRHAFAMMKEEGQSLRLPQRRLPCPPAPAAASSCAAGLNPIRCR
jgi:small subunit ribosomal protein S6